MEGRKYRAFGAHVKKSSLHGFVSLLLQLLLLLLGEVRKKFLHLQGANMQHVTDLMRFCWSFWCLPLDGTKVFSVELVRIECPGNAKCHAG